MIDSEPNFENMLNVCNYQCVGAATAVGFVAAHEAGFRIRFVSRLAGTPGLPKPTIPKLKSQVASMQNSFV